MEITWLGHSAFRLRGRDVSIVTDPYGGDDWGYPALSVPADVVTVSHDHPHHAHAEAIVGRARVFTAPGEYEIRGAMIWGVPTARKSSSADVSASRNTAYVIQIEDLTVCHLGDLGRTLSTEELTRIKDCDVLLVPVGGHCTINAAQAAEVVSQVEPKLVVPMHYATDETRGRVELDEVEKFCREMGATEVAPQNRLSVTPSSLPAEPAVVLLERRR